MTIGAIIVAVGLPSFSKPAGRDHGVYLYAGRQTIAGQLPHRDVFDQRPPGVTLVYAASMMLFGQTMRAMRWMDILEALGIAGAPYRAARRVFGRSAGLWTALVAGTTYQVLFNWLDSFQCDGFMTLPLILAVSSAVSGEESGSPRDYGWAGFSCGVAALFKPVAAIVAVGIGIKALAGRPRKGVWPRLVSLGVGIAVPYD